MALRTYWHNERQSWSKSRVAVVVALCLMVGTIFLIIGFFARSCGGGGGDGGGGGGDGSGADFAKLIREANQSMRAFALGRLQASRIRLHLEAITRKPHVATQADDPARVYVESHWTATLGRHERAVLATHAYSVLLSRARDDPARLSRFEILPPGGGPADYASQTVERPLTQYDNDTGIPAPILAYAPSGDVTGPVVYANYGSLEDLRMLNSSLSINLTGATLLTRYGGGVGRGQKAVNARPFGAAGVLIFSDPADVAKEADRGLFPAGWWLPPTGVQKGSAMLESGDPETPGYPSVASSYRHDATARGVLPPLPMYPIGYGDASAILSRLEGPEAPDSWRVSIPGLNASRPIRLGPELTDGRRLRLLVNQENFRKEIVNSCVRVRGEIEPDRWVIVGNHRDAWGYGAVDPSSGTAVLMEFSQILADMLEAGWQPRRSIMLCTWDGEEHGLIGSWEWVEDNLMMLKESVVAYVNIDISVAGNYSMRTSAVPCLRAFAKTLMDGLPEEVNPGYSMGDTWSARWANGKSPMEGMSTPLGGSDYAAFIELGGIPAIDIMFRADPNVSSLYPMYHARYESFHYVDTFVDPGFKAHLSSARLLVETTRQLADEYLLPYALNMSSLAQEVATFYANANATVGRLTLVAPDLRQELADLGSGVANLHRQAALWDGQSVNRRSPLGVRRINDAAMRAMQSFLAGRGQPRRPYVSNLMFASSKFASRARFPGLSDLLYELEFGRATVAEIKEHLSALTYHVGLAARLLTVHV